MSQSPSDKQSRLKALSDNAAPGPWQCARVGGGATGPHEPISMWIAGAGPRAVPWDRSTCIHADDMEFIAALVNAYRAGELVAPSHVAAPVEVQSDPERWTEEAKARLNLALFGKTDKPLAWVQANGKLLYEESEATPGQRLYPLYAKPTGEGVFAPSSIEPPKPAYWAWHAKSDHYLVGHYSHEPKEPSPYYGKPLYLSAPSAIATPLKGWRLVPCIPTQAMVNALHHGTWEGEKDPKPGHIEDRLWRQTYEAMLDAAPSAPTDGTAK